MIISSLKWFAQELGLSQLHRSESQWDIVLSYASRLIRLFGFGLVSPILIIYLNTNLGISNQLIGMFLSLTLWGDVILSLIVTWSADKIGRRNTLAIGSFLMSISGIIFASSSSYLVLLLAAMIGVISPSGNEVGPFAAIEVGVLSQLVDPVGRVYILMWYQVLGFVGTALGNLTSGWIVNGVSNSGHSLHQAYRAVFWVYAIVGGVKMVLSLMLTDRTELRSVPPPDPPTQSDERAPLLPNLSSSSSASSGPLARSPDDDTTLRPSNRFPVTRLVSLCILFGFDSFASALIPASFIAYYLNIRFHAPLSVVTSTLGAGAIISGSSQLLAGSIARRLGIIITMVATHMPAQVLTIAFGLAPTLPIALTLLVARFSIASMDTSVRSAFLAAIVPELHRTRFLGIINVCKTLSNSLGYSLAGQLAEMRLMNYGFVICGMMKLCYDLGLLIGFKTVRLEH